MTPDTFVRRYRLPDRFFGQIGFLRQLDHLFQVIDTLLL